MTRYISVAIMILTVVFMLSIIPGADLSVCAAGNLFGTNADFESGTAGWTLESGAKFAVTDADKHTGTRSLRLTSQTTGSARFAMVNSLPILTAGKTYLYTFWYKMDVPEGGTINENGYNSFYVYVRSGTKVYVAQTGKTLINDNRWHQYTQTFTAESGFEALTHLGVRDYNTIEGAAYYFDDFELIREEDLYYGLREEAYIDSVTGRRVNVVGMDGAHTLHGYHTSRDTSDDGKRMALSVFTDDNYKEGTAYFDDFDLSAGDKTEQNLFHNAGFELGEHEWLNDDTTRYSITSDEAHTGARSLKLEGKGSAANTYFRYKNTLLAALPDTPYIFSFWYKVVWPGSAAIDTGKTAKVQLRANPNNVVLVDTQKGFGDIYGTSGEGLTIDGEWHKFTAVFNSKPKGLDQRTELNHAGIRDTNTQDGALYYFDDFSLRPLRKGELAVSGVEDKAVTPFFIDQSAAGTLTIDSMEHHSGSRSLKFATAKEDKSAYLPYIPLVPNTDYNLSFWYKANEAGMDLRMYDAANTWYGTGTSVFTEALSGTGGEWRKYSKNFNSGANGVVTLRLRCMQEGRICYFDDFALSRLFEATAEISTINFQSTNKINGRIQAANNSGITKTVLGIMAAYEKQSRRILACDYNPVVLANGANTDFSLELTAPEVSYDIKLFAWEGTDRLFPLTNAVSFDPITLAGLQNGGFEDGMAPWKTVGDPDKFTISHSEQNSGTNSLKFTAGPKSGMLGQKITVEKNTSYTLSFYAKADTEGTKLGLYDKIGRQIFEMPINVTFVWEQYKLPFNSSDNDEVEIRIFKGLPAVLTDAAIENKKIDLVLYDTVEKESYFIDRADKCSVGTSGGNQYFYRNEEAKTYSADMLNFPYQKHLVTNSLVVAPYSVTMDGRYIGGAIGGWTGNGPKLARIDTATGTLTELFDPVFPTQPFNIFNHAIISPVNPNVLYYGHGGIDLASNQYSEGDGPGDGKDIMWIYNHAATGGKRERLLYKQHTSDNLPDGPNAEWITHVVFSADGQGIYGVKIPIQNGTPPNGIIYAPITGITEGEELVYINSDYRYLHVSASPDGRYLVADTDYSCDSDPKGNYKIILVDLQTRKSMLLTQFHYDLSHSGLAHAHPTFSNDSSKVIFSIDRGGHIWTAYMDITEIEE